MSVTANGFHERRQYPRFTVNDDSLVILSPGDIISFRVLDVSMSGLAFCYNGDIDDTSNLNSSMMTLLTESINSIEIPVHLVKDEELDHQKYWHLFSISNGKKPYLRRCGVKFSHLTEGEKSQMEEYIRSL